MKRHYKPFSLCLAAVFLLSGIVFNVAKAEPAPSGKEIDLLFLLIPIWKALSLCRTARPPR